MIETWDEIVAVMQERQSLDDLAIQEMLEIRRRYNGDWAIPLPDVQHEPNLPPITPALIAEAIDNVGMLAASVFPYMTSPPINMAKEDGVRSREYASIRRKILYGSWNTNAGAILLRRGYRHLAGYATTTMTVRPDFGLARPVLELRDPLSSYPDPTSPEDLSPPLNIGYVYQRSSTYLRLHYPAVRNELGGPIGESTSGVAELWDCIEWMDDKRVVCGILGPRDPNSESVDAWQKSAGGRLPTIELGRWDNPIGMCPCVTPKRITLDRVASQVAHTVGMLDLMAQIMGLALIAEERAVFADRYAVGSRNGPPTIVSNGGQWMDGRTGEINLLDNVDTVGQLAQGASQTSLQMVDRLERNFKVSGSGLVPAMGGETYGALRTGRGIDSMLGAAVDPRVQELQEIMSTGMVHLNTIMLETWKAHWADRKVILQTGWSSGALVEFTPKTHIEHAHNVVKYPVPGTDAQGTTVTLGQMYGTGAISMTTLRRLHPWIDDPEAEGQLRDEEDLEFAIMESIKQQAVQGAMPAIYVAEIEKARRQGKDIFEAVQLADAAIKEQQAAALEQPPPDSGMMAPPEAMPGLAGGTDAAAGLPMMPPEAMPGAVQGPNSNQANFEQLAQALQAG